MEIEGIEVGPSGRILVDFLATGSGTALTKFDFLLAIHFTEFQFSCLLMVHVHFLLLLPRRRNIPRCRQPRHDQHIMGMLLIGLGGRGHFWRLYTHFRYANNVDDDVDAWLMEARVAGALA